MNKELNIGEYVRTKYGIAKLIKIEDDEYFFDNIVAEYSGKFEHDYIKQLFKEDLDKIVIKSSPNIIDLIEVGDYVNGLKVSNVGGTYHGRKDKAIYCDYCENKETVRWTMIYDDEIKSIVTKEQFESMEYKIGE